MDVEIGNNKQQVNPKVRTCVGLDSKSKSNEETLLTMEIMRIMATTTARMTEMVTLVITSTMATMMTWTMETATTMVKMMLIQVVLHLKLFIVLRRMMVAMRLKKLTQVRVILDVVAASNPMVANEVV